MNDSRFEVRPAPEKGKGLFALTSFKKGDIIFEEDPLISCQFTWNQDCGYRACDHCIRPLETTQENAVRLSMNECLTIPYPEQCNVDKSKHVQCQSCNVTYCSEECQKLAWDKYHKTLCLRKLENDGTHPLEVLKQIWKEMHYPPETTTIMLLARIFAMIHQAEDKSSILSTIAQFCHPSASGDDISSNVLGLKFSNQLDILREQLVHCVPTESAPQWITPDGFRSLIALVGMNGQGIGTSAVSDWVKNVQELNLPGEEREAVDKFISDMYDSFEKEVGEFLNVEGSGLYCLESTVNHSCKPNAEIAFLNSNYRLAVRCLVDIEPDEEICINYLNDCVLERSRHTRQKMLETNYFFKCKCPLCESESDQPDETSEEDDDEEEEDEEME